MYDSLGSLFEDMFGTSEEDVPASVFDHIAAHIDPSGVGLLDGGDSLPDESIYAGRGAGLAFAPGAREAVMAYHGNDPKSPEAVKAIVSAAKKFGDSGDVDDLRELYTTLRRDEMVSVIDDVMLAICEFPDDGLEHILQAALAFLYRAPDRGPVKFALSVLGQTDGEQLLDDLMLVARHEEFTIYAAIAIEKIMPDPAPVLFDLARSIQGWGRVELVHRLSDWTDATYCEWVLLEGFRNTVLDEYLAFTAAEQGNLLGVLRNRNCSDRHMEAACDIITALIRGGPAQDMTDYADGAAVVELYLENLMGREISIRQFVSLFEIQDFLDDVDIDWDMRMAFGWTPRRRESMHETLKSLLRRTDVLPKVQKALLSEDADVFESALQAADMLDLNTWDVVFQRVAAQPDRAIRWFDAARRMTGTEVDQLVSLARGHMNLSELGQGPGIETGVGSEFGVHDALMFVVQELGRFVNAGTDIVLTGLRSPLIPSRWTAVRSLDMWARIGWTQDVWDAFEAALRQEPNDDLRDYMDQVISRKPKVIEAEEE